MTKLDINFRLDVGDDIEEMLASMGIKLSATIENGAREDALKVTEILSFSQEESSASNIQGLRSSGWVSVSEASPASRNPKKVSGSNP